MKNRSLSILILPIFIIGFVFESYGSNDDLCDVLYEMSLDDQRYRGTTDKISDYYPKILDSLILDKGFTKKEFNSLPENQQGKLKQRAFSLAGKQLKPMMVQNDSLRELQLELDAKNTLKLIEITKKHGWQTSKSLGCDQRFRTVLIFRHAPEKYWNEIRDLIDKERNEKRMSGYEYYVIDNHLKGRPPMTKKSSDFVD